MGYKISNLDFKAAIQNFSDEYKEIALVIYNEKSETFRATKPKMINSKPITGKAAYVWRNLMFYISQNRKLQCMPTTADFDLPAFDQNGRWSSSLSRDMSKELDLLVDNLLSLVPPIERHGLRTWARALGY